MLDPIDVAEASPSQPADAAVTPARSLLVDFNRTDAAYPAHRTILSLIADQVARTPDGEAVRFADRALTYRTLNARANQLAASLASVGVGPGQVVALAMEHSLEVVCAILGILKTGAAYAPVDPAIPRKRLVTILGELAAVAGGGLPVLVTQPHLTSQMPQEAARVVALDADFRAVEAFSDADAPDRAAPDGLAYVIFTSGSTGTPKGVMIEHRSLVNYVWWAAAQYAQGEALTWPLFSSLAFDLTVTSIFTPLVTGGRIVVYAEEPGRQSLVVFKVIEDGAADIVKLTPAHLSMIKEANLAGTRIRRLIVGGEDFKTELARDITARFGRPVQIFNEYGPTEATVGCMIHRYGPVDDRLASVPIGRPAANARVYVLDADGRPAAPGVVGEMYLAGDGLARGYINRDDLTSRAFSIAPDPREFGATGARERLYRTGDLARWSPDGRMEFLGRADHQVKIGGFRIELGEIEAALLRHPAVRDAVVAVVRRPDADAGGAPDRLVAYVVADAAPAPSELRAHLGAHLPEYMLPAFFVALDALPLTANGKVDRSALPEPDLTEVTTSAAVVAARTAAERMVLDVFAEVLGRTDLGVTDNFFELGGHSLMAARLITRLQAVSGLEISLGSLFERPTPEGLAEIVESLSWAATAGPVPEAGAGHEEIEL